MCVCDNTLSPLVLSLGAAQEWWGEDICNEDPKEAPHRGHETAGAYPIRETNYAGGAFRFYSQVPLVAKHLLH